jgi:hypothetical protein
VPGANDVLRKLAQEWAEKEKVDLTIDFITSTGEKILITIAAERQARTGHDILPFGTWQTPDKAEDLEPGLRSGWTVLVDGVLTVVDDEATAERLGRLADPWLRELRPIVLVLTATQITGRALHPAGGVHIVQADEWS